MLLAHMWVSVRISKDYLASSSRLSQRRRRTIVKSRFTIADNTQRYRTRELAGESIKQNGTDTQDKQAISLYLYHVANKLRWLYASCFTTCRRASRSLGIGNLMASATLLLLPVFLFYQSLICFFFLSRTSPVCVYCFDMRREKRQG